MSCELCEGSGGTVVASNEDWRIIRADDERHPFTYRVIANEHAKEITDLAPYVRLRLFEAVTRLEAVLLRELRPVKMNVASLGNLTPHVHWHLIPRFADDPHFPQPVWGPVQRATTRPKPSAEDLARVDRAVETATRESRS
jgi:diadenosine tetraphosphate (Ap4A) HIT family hydrolase